MLESQLGGNEKIARAVPACPVRNNHPVSTRRQVFVHQRCVRPVRHVGDADSVLRAGGAERMDAAIATVARDAGAAFRMDHPEGLLDFSHDVPKPPACHTVPLKIRTCLGPGADLRASFRRPSLPP